MALAAAKIEIREDSNDALAATDLPHDDMVLISDPVRMYLQQIGRYPLLTSQQEVELSMQMEAGIRAEEKLAAGGDLSIDEKVFSSGRYARRTRRGNGWSRPTCGWWCR